MHQAVLVKKIRKFEKPLQIKSKQRTNAVKPLMGEKLLQPTLEGSGSKSVSNINPFGYSASPESKKNKPDAIGEVCTPSNATQSKPTFSRQGLGAGL